MKKMAFRFIALTISCLVSLLTAEVILRVSNLWIGRHSDTMFTVIEHDQTLGWKMKANISEKVDFVDVEGIPVHSNSLGFWDEEIDLQKTVSRYRIAFLGDSFTWGMGVQEGERFTNLLAANNGWEALNFGVPGYGTDQSFQLWQHIANRYNPDLVVLTVYQNDYADNMYIVRYGRRKPYFSLNGDGKLELRNVPVAETDFWDDGIFNQLASEYASHLSDPVERRSRIVHWLVKNLDLARFLYTMSKGDNARTDEKAAQPSPTSDKANIAGESTEVSARSDLDRMQLAQIDLMNAIVKHLAEEVRATGAQFIVVLAGNSIPQYEIQKKEFANVGIACIDATTDVLSKKLPNSSNQVYYPYNKHWSPAAHQAVAELLAEGIRGKGFCATFK